MKHTARLLTLALCASLLAGCSGTGPVGPSPGPATSLIPGRSPLDYRVPAAQLRAPAVSAERVIYYYQTQYSNGTYVSLAPIWKNRDPATKKPYVTNLIIAAFHLGYDSNNAPYIHLNDNVPGDPMFNVMWPEVARLQGLGVPAHMMLGGAAQGSYADLFAHWSTFYPILKQTITQYKLDGIDLDVEENVSLPNIEKLITQLNTDFGSNFLITLAPVASALWGGANLSGFDYRQLAKSPAGAKVAWYNGQFYSGFATLASPADYTRAVNAGFSPSMVVGGMIANPSDGSGYVPMSTVVSTVDALVDTYPTFGGVAAWEYFNAEPGGPAKPAEWGTVMGKAMRAGF